MENTINNHEAVASSSAEFQASGCEQDGPAHQPSTWKVADSAPEDVKEFINKFFPEGLVYLHNSFLAYSSGYWSSLNDRSDIQKAIATFYASAATAAKVRELFCMLKFACVVKDSDFRPNSNYICFQNGALDMTSYELVPHNPAFHLRSGRNATWDEGSKAPTFEKFLQDIFRDDDDRDEKIQFVLEWMGLCLIPDTSFEKFVVCVGDGGNGKSVLLKLIAEMLGSENVYSAPIQRLGNRRALAELDGKLLLTSSEINENTVMDDGILKQIVSGDMVEGERKYEHPFTFTPCARIMLATNHLPKLRDVTHAFFRRLVMIRFNRNFTAEEMDMHLPGKLSAELAGIFAMAIDGLRSLRARGRFVVPQSSNSAAEQYREDSDVIKLFAEEALVRSDGKGMQPAALYKLYMSWAAAYGFKTENIIVLGKRLKQLEFHNSRSNGKAYWHVKMSPAGEEIASKRSARVVEIDIKSGPKAAVPVENVSAVGHAANADQPLAA